MQGLERKPHASRGAIDLIDASGDCWVWTGRIDRDGYGRFGKYGRMAHRLVWESLVGPIPDGFHVDHLCRNKACVNPDHLEPCTPAVNVRRTPPGRKGKHGNHFNSQKTHCQYGHPLEGNNLYRTPMGYRNCKTCRREYQQRLRYNEPARSCSLYCKRGHVQFGPEADIYTDPSGVRVCRPCRRIRESDRGVTLAVAA